MTYVNRIFDGACLTASLRPGNLRTWTTKTMQSRRFLGRVARIATTVSVIGAAFVSPVAHADDPLVPIKVTVERDREKGCHDVRNLGASFQYDRDLEAIAQNYARKEGNPDTTPPKGFQTIYPFLGAGDPQAQATTRAYDKGARKMIGNCTLDRLSYGVGFVRYGDRSVDVVTIVLGVRNPPIDPPETELSKYCKKLGDVARVRPECGGVR